MEIIPNFCRGDPCDRPFVTFCIVLGEYKIRPYGRKAVILKGLLRNIPQHLVQLHIHRGRTILLIMDNETQVTSDLTQHLAAHLFPFTDGLELLNILRADQKAVALLVLGHVDLQHRHGGVADPDFADLDAPAGMLHQFLGKTLAGPPAP